MYTTTGFDISFVIENFYQKVVFKKSNIDFILYLESDKKV